MRANRCGYRVVLANRAWVYHSGGPSFPRNGQKRSNHDDKCTQLLERRYPEYRPSVRRYLNSERYEAEQVLAGLAPGRDRRLDLLFDFSSMGPQHNGTSSLSKEILARAPGRWNHFNLYVMVSEEARRFHDLDQFDGVGFVPLDVQRKFAIGLRPVQPFALEQVARLSRLAAVNVYAMLDPIMFDCQYLNSGNPDDLETLWAAVFSHADGVIYISDFASDLFHRRFQRRQGLRELVAYPSLDVEDYKNRYSQGPLKGEHILVIGNRFDHKRVGVTIDALCAAFPDQKIVSVGSRIDAAQHVVSFSSGDLNREKMHELFSGARLVVYPSIYEGFGLPILEGLAYEKPVLARSIPVTHVIQERINSPGNLILFSSTSDLVERLKTGIPAPALHRRKHVWFPTWKLGRHDFADWSVPIRSSTVGGF